MVVTALFADASHPYKLYHNYPCYPQQAPLCTQTPNPVINYLDIFLYVHIFINGARDYMHNCYLFYKLNLFKFITVHCTINFFPQVACIYLHIHVAYSCYTHICSSWLTKGAENDDVEVNSS